MSLLYIRKKKIFFYQHKLLNSISLLYMHKKKINLFYLHKAVNNFECFSLIKITLSFFSFYIFKPNLIELFH